MAGGDDAGGGEMGMGLGIGSRGDEAGAGVMRLNLNPPPPGTDLGHFSLPPASKYVTIL